MLQEEMEEQLQTLTKQVEELRSEVETLKEQRFEEPRLIPGAEYDFVPSLKPKVIARGIGRIVRIVNATHELGLSAREWEQFSSDEDTNE
jgi:hypothetical protein